MARKRGDLIFQTTYPLVVNLVKNTAYRALACFLRSCLRKRKSTAQKFMTKSINPFSAANSTAQIVVIMDSPDKPPTVLLALATRISEELFDGEAETHDGEAETHAELII